MKGTTDIKENIIKATTELIEHSDGGIRTITARGIAEKASIGLGLINYHFGSKDNLITICVQRIISNVINRFDVKKAYKTDKERLTAWAVYVFEFLFENPAISRISILCDIQNYTADCNSVYTQKGFMLALINDVSDRDKPILVFVLTAAMQMAFLGSETAKQLLGYDFTKSEDRAAYINKLIDILFERTVQIYE